MTAISNVSSSSLPVNPTLNLLETCKTMTELRPIHAHMIKTNLVNHTYAVSRLMAFCSLSGVNGDLHYSYSVLRRIKNPNAFIFYTVIKGFAESSNPYESLNLYGEMLSCLDEFDGVGFSVPSVLKACGKMFGFDEGKQVHGQILKTQLQFDLFVMNPLVRMYLEFGDIELARKVFDKMCIRDVISWNSMITGYLRAGEVEQAGRMFDQMPERDLVSCNAMIDGYGKCGKCELAEDIFNMMKEKDVVTWTSMISAYVNCNRSMEALDLFQRMLKLDVQPDTPAIVTALSAIANLGFVEEGKWIHAYITNNNISLSSGFMGSAVIDMYSKCGFIENARDVFKSISHKRNIGDYNSMISGLALHGLAQEACELFTDMEKMQIMPNEITFLELLSACSHAGLVNEGCFYYKIMVEKYCIDPKIQHYGCMIDMFSRAGRLKEALEVIQNMPMKADLLAWKAILSAGLKYNQTDIGQKAAHRAIELAPKDSSLYVMLSNIYAKVGKWDRADKIRLFMKARGVKKIPGCSSIFIDGKVYEFFAGKLSDQRYRDVVLSKIDEIVVRLKLEGYEPDLTQVLLDIEDEDEKTRSLSLHSEKMAVAFGLISTRETFPIHVVKNLRICCDCHVFIKLVSRVYKRRIVVRDQNRFHHFENGSCSCNDYW